MPTKSDLLSPIRKGWKNFGNSSPLHLGASTIPGFGHARHIYKWISGESAGHVSLSDPEPGLLREAYSSLLASDAAQVFIGMADDHPFCEIDLFKVRQHAISLAYEDRPGDYYLDLLPAPPTPREHMSELLNHAMGYFFSFDEVRRIMTEADRQYEWMNGLLTCSGFRLYKKVSVPYRNSNLYFSTRKSLML